MHVTDNLFFIAIGKILSKYYFLLFILLIVNTHQKISSMSKCKRSSTDFLFICQTLAYILIDVFLDEFYVSYRYLLVTIHYDIAF
jgi:hypothetical protein